MTLFIVGVSISLVISFICSLAEASLLSLTPSQVADISNKHPAIGSIWQRMKANIERPIAVILILNTTAHTIGASVAGSQFATLFGDEWILAFSLLFTIVMLQFTEILPKTLGVHHNKRLAIVLARPLAGSVKILSPVISLLHFLNRPFEGKGTKDRPPATIEEIASLAAMARVSKHIGPHEERIIKNASRLSQTKASQVMIPIEQVSMVSSSMTLTEAMVSAHIDAHTRYPVHEGEDRSKVVGYVNFKEMIFFMKTNIGDPSLKGIMRPVHFVEPDSSASDLLKSFIEQHEHIAIVRDTHGKALGLITLEDLVEELVGELMDEFDRLPRHVHGLSGGTWMFGGGVSVHEVSEKLGVPGISTEPGTLAAFIEKGLGHQPKSGDVLVAAGIEFVARRIRRGRVFEANARMKAPQPNTRTREA